MNWKIYALTILLALNNVLAIGQATVTKNIDYVVEEDYAGDKDLLDIYMPANAKDVPTIVYFHGGALLNGDKSQGELIGNQMVKAGIGFVCANYRLSPDFQHPTHVQDACAATAWVIKNIDEYGGDPKKVYVGGHSAGAYLAALLAVDSSLLQAQELTMEMISGAVLISPFLFVEETARDRIKLDSVYQTIWGIDSTDWMKASVTPHIGPSRDNILLIYADGDDAWRKEQIHRFAQAMKNVDNENILVHEIPDRTHGSLVDKFPTDDELIIRLISNFVLNSN